MAPAEQKPNEGIDLNALRAGLTVTVMIGLTVGLVVALVAGGKEVLTGMLALPLGWLLLALGISALSWLGQGLGFAALSSVGIKGNLMRMTSAFLGGDFAALVTPFGSGGIPVGIFCLHREGLTTGESSAIIAMHSLLTGAFFLVAGGTAAVVLPMATRGAQIFVWASVAAIALVVGAILALTLKPEAAVDWLDRTLAKRWVSRMLGEDRAERFAARTHKEALRFAGDIRCLTRESPGQILLSFVGLFSSRICIMLCLPVIVYGLAPSYGWHGDLLPLLATAIGAMALAIVSPTPGGSGAVEVATTALLATQMPSGMAGAAALLWRGATYYTELIAGWIAFTRYIAMKPRGAKEAGGAEAPDGHA
jgi:uncharacterized protein (TIRG00374 family)